MRFKERKDTNNHTCSTTKQDRDVSEGIHFSHMEL